MHILLQYRVRARRIVLLYNSGSPTRARTEIAYPTRRVILLHKIKRFAADGVTNTKPDVEEGFAAPSWLNGGPTKRARVTVVFRWRRVKKMKTETKIKMFRFERKTPSVFFSAIAGSVYDSPIANIFHFQTSLNCCMAHSLRASRSRHHYPF